MCCEEEEEQPRVPKSVMAQHVAGRSGDVAAHVPPSVVDSQLLLVLEVASAKRGRREN